MLNLFTRLLAQLRRGPLVLTSRLRLSENTFMAILAVAIGLLSGLCNFAFRRTIEFFHWLVIEQGVNFFAIDFNQFSPQRFWVVLFPTDIHRSRSDAALAQSLVVFANAMEFELVAEGIEEAVQHERLRQIGFAYGQGYLFAKPLPEAEFLALVRAGQPLIH